MNGLFLGTKNEDLKLLSYVENAEYQTSRAMDTYMREMFENYRRANGKIYSNADLDKLNLEKRPAFVYNLFRPILLQLAGNYRQNLGKIECTPRTPNDLGMVNIANDLMDYALLTANNYDYETTKSYINAIIGRIGWIYTDFRYDIDPKGMFWYESYNPFRVLFDTEKGTSNQKKWNYIIDRGYYTTEEIRNLFAQDDMDKYDEITEKSKILLGESDIRKKQILTMIERVWGLELYYQGKETGYDAYSAAFTNLQYGNTEYLDYNSGRFKVIDFHERRCEAIMTAYFPQLNKELDITESLDRLVAHKDGDKRSSEYRNAIAAFTERTRDLGYGESIIKRKIINQIHQTAVCPALNMILANDPYTVQNGNFKLIPVFCFEMDQEVLEWKSYIDDLIDPVRGINLNLNTIQTHLMKTSIGETWYEEDALLEHEDEFIHSSINGFKKVKRGKLDKIKKINPPSLPAGNAQVTQILQELVKNISTVRDNALGTREQSGESGKLFESRVAQTDLLQIIPQDNAAGQLKILGENCLDNLFHYLTPDRVIRIVGDDGDPYWIQINEDSITKLFYKGNEVTGQETINAKLDESKFDIIISKVPYGQGAKQKEFQEIVAISNILMSMQRPDLIMPEYIIKSSGLRNKDEWIQFIKLQTQNQSDMIRQQQALSEQQKEYADQDRKLNMIKQLTDAEMRVRDLQDKDKESEVDNMISNTLTQIAS